VRTTANILTAKRERNRRPTIVINCAGAARFKMPFEGALPGIKFALGEVAINVDVIGIENSAMLAIEETEMLPSFDSAFDCYVRMAIDNAGHHKLARGIDNLRVFGSFDGRANLGNFAILNEDGSMLKRTVSNRENGGILNQDDRTGFGRRGDRK